MWVMLCLQQGAAGGAGRKPSRRCLLLQARPWRTPGGQWVAMVKSDTSYWSCLPRAAEHQALAPVSRIQAQTHVWRLPQVISRPLDKDMGPDPWMSPPGPVNLGFQPG